MKTYWHCEKCGCHGCVGHLKRSGVMEVVTSIRDDHERQGRAGCEFDHFKVRTSLHSLRPKPSTVTAPQEK